MRPTREEAIAGVEVIIGYTFTNSDLLWEALQAPGSGVQKASHKPSSRYLPEGNLRLAVYGDALLQLIIIEDWIDENVARSVADFRRKAITTNHNLQRTFHRHGLDKFVYLDQSLDDITPRLRADAMEAILGAVGIDAKDGCLKVVRFVMGTVGLLMVPTTNM